MPDPLRPPPQPIERLVDGIRRHPDAIAIGGPEPLTYARLGAAVDAVAAAFQSLDTAGGSRVGICARNTVEHLIALLATYRAGKVWVPLNPRNGRAELDSMIAATKPGIVVADASCLDRFTPPKAPLILGKSPSQAPGESIRRMMTEWAGRAPTPVERDQADAQVLKFSGGSTGTPKPVIQSIRCINAQADGILEFFELRADDVNLIAAPLTHGASCFVLPVFAAGGRHVLLEDPTPRRILDTILTDGVTTLYAPPTMLYGMIEAAGSGESFPTLRHVIYSAAPMSPERIRECQRVFGPVIETAYGQVEAPQIVTAMRAAELLIDRNLSSVGRATSVATVSIRTADGAPAGAAEVGEIVVGGPLLMTGYLDRPDLTSQVIEDGLLHTGDVGTIDDRGYLYIRGRLRELINSGGFKVYPGEVEGVLGRHPAVSECAVFGIPDEKWGEAVNAAVVLSAGAAASPAELISFVKGELGSVKAPKTVWIVEGLPRNAAGKVSRAEVRDRVLASPALSGSD
jgi:fatty-acyl-CoA synthase